MEMVDMGEPTPHFMIALLCTQPGTKCWLGPGGGPEPTGMCPYTFDGMYINEAKCSQQMQSVCRYKQ